MYDTSQDTLLRNAFEFAAIGTALVGLDGRWLRVNAALCRMLGYSDTELRNLTFQTITHVDDLQLDRTSAEQLLSGDIGNYQVEKRYFHKSGRIIWVLLHVSLIRDEKGRPEIFIAQFKDITQRKTASQLTETFFELPVVLHFVAGFDGYFKKLSAGWTNALGHSLEYLLSVPYLDLVHPEDRSRTAQAAQRLYEGEPVSLFENRYRHEDGSYRWLLWAGVPVRAESTMYGVALDYTGKKETEMKLERTLRSAEQLVGELRSSQAKFDNLRRGLLTVCAWTHRVQHEGRWMSMSEFLSDHLHLNLTHGISDEGMKKALAETDIDEDAIGKPEEA